MNNRGFGRTPKVFYPTQRRSYSSGPKIKFNPKLIISLLILVGLGVGLYFLSRVPAINIKDVLLTPADQPIMDQLSSLKGESLFSAKINRTVRLILSEDYSIESLDCKKGIPSTLNCTFSRRTPRAVWVSNGTEMLVDNNGFVYNYTAQNKEGLMVITDGGNVALKEGDRVIDTKLLAVYSKIGDTLAKSNFTIKGLKVIDTFFQVEVTLGDGKLALFNIDRPIETQVLTLRSVYDQGKTEGKNIIDLRVDSKVYLR